MRIAQIAPIIESVPPKKYGGTERVVYALTEELVRLGHEVTLFASGDSLTSAKLISVVPKSLRELFPQNKMNEVYGMNYMTIFNIGLAYQMQDKFDVIHDHTAHYGLLAANNSQTPVVMTLHGNFDDNNKRLFQALNNPYFVTISDAQAKPVPNLNRIGTVYNGLNMTNYPFSNTNEGYLLFVGRISEEKGVHNAIEVANRLRKPLIIAAKLDTSHDPDVAYFKKFVKPFINDQIRWIGEVTEEERNELMSKALAFLHLITWPEPFGLTLIEAMACGCPVVAFRNGSIPEVIEQDKTGFVVETVDEAIEAVKQIKNIDRSYCREYSLTQFGTERMTQGYLRAYKEAITRKKQLLSKKNIMPSPVFQRNLKDEYTRVNKPFISAYSQEVRRDLKQIPARSEFTLKTKD